VNCVIPDDDRRLLKIDIEFLYTLEKEARRHDIARIPIGRLKRSLFVRFQEKTDGTECYRFQTTFSGNFGNGVPFVCDLSDLGYLDAA
jgi:hypothetical protein